MYKKCRYIDKWNKLYIKDQRLITFSFLKFALD